MAKLSEIAKLVGGVLKGDGDIEISSFCSLENPSEGAIAFLESEAQKGKLRDTKISALITTPALKDLFPNVIITDNPRLAFVRVMDFFLTQKEKVLVPGIHPLASVSKSAILGEEVSIGAYCVIEDKAVLGNRVTLMANCFVGRGAMIGDNTKLFPGVSVLERCEIGKNCIIHAGTVIGSDGFGYVTTRDGHRKFPQVGKVVIEDDVEIGALCAIDRAALDETRIGRGTKIDNLVQIAHNVKIGEHCLIAAQVGISGRTEIGSWCVVGGQAGFQGGISIGEGSVIAAQSGVFGSLQPKSRVSGYPARPHGDAMRILALTWRLPELVEKIRALEKELASLKKKRKSTK